MAVSLIYHNRSESGEPGGLPVLDGLNQLAQESFAIADYYVNRRTEIFKSCNILIFHESPYSGIYNDFYNPDKQSEENLILIRISRDRQSERPKRMIFNTGEPNGQAIRYLLYVTDTLGMGLAGSNAKVVGQRWQEVLNALVDGETLGFYFEGRRDTSRLQLLSSVFGRVYPATKLQALAVLCQGYLVAWACANEGQVNAMRQRAIAGLDPQNDAKEDALGKMGWLMMPNETIELISRETANRYYDTEAGVQSARWWDVFGMMNRSRHSLQDRLDALETGLRKELGITDDPLPGWLKSDSDKDPSGLLNLIRGGRLNRPEVIAEAYVRIREAIL